MCTRAIVDRSRASLWPFPFVEVRVMNGYLLRDGMRRAIVRDILKRLCSCAPLVLAGVPLTTTAQDTPAFQARGDIAQLPTPLKNFLTRIAGRPNATFEPMRAFAEADKPSQLFQ